MHLGGKSSQSRHFPFLTEQIAQYFFVTHSQIDSRCAHASHFLAFEQLVEL